MRAMTSLLSCLSCLAGVACFSKPSFQGAGPGDGGIDAPPSDAYVAPDTITRLSVGYRHGCRVTTGGQIACWGDNEQQQLGRDLVGAEWTGTPGYAAAGEAGWTTVAAGGLHTCGVRAGKVRCWGENSFGQTDPARSGTGDDIQYADAADLPITGTVEKVYAGDTLSCAVTSDRELWCWGDVGFDTNQSPARPRKMLDGRFVDVALADDHACALRETGIVACWGKNDRLQLGRDTAGAQIDATAAMPIEDPLPYQSVSAAHGVTCGVRSDRALVCWGSSATGLFRHDDGNPPLTATMYVVDTMRPWTHVAIGSDHACAATDDETAFCWGDNYLGALGNGRYEADRSDLQAVVGLPATTAITEMSANFEHTCVLLADDSVRCWGSNSKGELGNGEASRKLTPTKIELGTTPTTIDELVAGDQHTCARAGSTTWCWGLNDKRQVLPSSPAASIDAPVQASTAPFEQIAAAYKHTCGRRGATGAITCWGGNDSNQLGSMVPSNTTADVPPPTNHQWTSLDVGSTLSCAIATDGKLYCWGARYDGTTDHVPTVVPAPNALPWRSISIGSQFAIGAVLDGGNLRIVAWGNQRKSGYADVDTALTAPALLSVPDVGTNVLAAAAETAGDHACIHHQVAAGPAVDCWGVNGSRQAGAAAPSWVAANAAIRVAGATWSTPAAGKTFVANDHSCSLDAAGDLWCWGANTAFELGSANTSTDVRQVFPGPWKAIAGGQTHSCAIKAGGAGDEVYCWGENYFGQVGDGTRWEPSAVLVLPVP